MFAEAHPNPVDERDHTRQRVQALSPEKRKLLALRLGLSQQSTPQTQDKLVAFVKGDANTEELHTHLSEQLPQYMIPSQIITVAEFQRTPNGKLDRAALKALANQQTVPISTPQTTELDDIEATIAAIWCELLRVKSVDADANFFHIGGHSLLAVRMLARVQTELDKAVPISIVLEAPTIRTLAAHFRQDIAPEQQKLRIAIQPDGDFTPLYCLPIPGLGVTVYQRLAPTFAGKRPIYGFDIPPQYDPYMPVEDLAAFFVDELLRTQPEGPYYLSGSSVGGLIAFEVGRQLRNRGIEDVVVMLFDTYCPTVEKVPSKAAKVTTWLRTNLQTLRSHDVNTVHHVGDVAWQVGKIVWEKVRDKTARTAQKFGVESQLRADYEGRSSRHKKYREVEQSFVPYTYDGTMLIYRATLVSFSGIQSPTLGWESLTTGNILVENVRGDHSGILQERYVQGVAERLLKNLAEFDEHYAAQ